MTTSPNTTRSSASLYIGIILVMIVQVISGLAIWKPVQFQELTALFYDFQGARLAHFIGMALIVLFLLVHVVLALAVPRTLVAMVTGGPPVDGRRAAQSPTAYLRRQRPSQREDDMAIRTPSPSIFRPRKRIDQSVAGREPQADRGDRPPQDPARRRQPWRADDAHRLRRHRPQRGAERVAGGVRMERRRAGVAVQSEQARADLHRGRGAAAAALQRLSTRSRR